MEFIKNIDKRKELAEIVYQGYGGLEDDEKKEYENEVGAAFEGYAKGLRDIAQLLVNGKTSGWDGETTLKVIEEYITSQYNGRKKENLFRISEIPSTKMELYIRTTVKEELIKNRCNKDDAERLVEEFINNPLSRENIIDEWELETIRVCNHCGAPMCEGYLWQHFVTYCSEDCVKKALNMDDKDFDEEIQNAGDDDAELYYTKWEG